MKDLIVKYWQFLLIVFITYATLGIYDYAVAGGKTKGLIKDAISAAPSSMSKTVTVVDWDGNVLRQGTGTYTCFPTPPNLKGKAPMCFDGSWSAWADGWQNKKSFKISNIGISYMLVGDGGASNIDPYAEGKTKDNDWVKGKSVV